MCCHFRCGWLHFAFLFSWADLLTLRRLSFDNPATELLIILPKFPLARTPEPMIVRSVNITLSSRTLQVLSQNGYGVKARASSKQMPHVRMHVRDFPNGSRFGLLNLAKLALVAARAISPAAALSECRLDGMCLNWRWLIPRAGSSR